MPGAWPADPARRAAAEILDATLERLAALRVGAPSTRTPTSGRWSTPDTGTRSSPPATRSSGTAAPRTRR
ncbi:hypothetical protein ACFQZ4_12255 [Catellatospora coxensis]